MKCEIAKAHTSYRYIYALKVEYKVIEKKRKEISMVISMVKDKIYLNDNHKVTLSPAQALHKVN